MANSASERTKRNLAAALKEKMAKKPLEQITIEGTDYIAVDQMTAEDVTRLESLAEQNLYLVVMQLY